jgi:hypothetical protein
MDAPMHKVDASGKQALKIAGLCARVLAAGLGGTKNHKRKRAWR